MGAGSAAGAASVTVCGGAGGGTGGVANTLAEAIRKAVTTGGDAAARRAAVNRLAGVGRMALKPPEGRRGLIATPHHGPKMEELWRASPQSRQMA
jgi:hypothetical protein